MKYIKNGDKRKIYAHKARKKDVPNKQSVLFFLKSIKQVGDVNFLLNI